MNCELRVRRSYGYIVYREFYGITERCGVRGTMHMEAVGAWQAWREAQLHEWKLIHSALQQGIITEGPRPQYKWQVVIIVLGKAR